MVDIGIGIGMRVIAERKALRRDARIVAGAVQLIGTCQPSKNWPMPARSSSKDSFGRRLSLWPPYPAFTIIHARPP